MDESTRLLALAHLHLGKTPTQVSDELDGVSYARALKLRKELTAAEESATVNELFELDAVALEMLIEAVKKKAEPAIEAFGVDMDKEVAIIREGVQGGQQLDLEFQSAADALAHRIKILATTANSAETLITLAKALAELQTAFYGQGAHSEQSIKDFESFITN